MNIFEIDDLLYELSEKCNYRQFHKLCRINKNLNVYYTNKINEYQSSYEKTFKMFNIQTILSSYKTILPKQINHKNCISYPNGNTILMCPKKYKLENIVDDIVKENNLDEIKLEITTLTLFFKIDISKQKYTNIISEPQKRRLNCKLVIINKIKFKVFMNGSCQVATGSKWPLFIDTYKQFIYYINHL